MTDIFCRTCNFWDEDSHLREGAQLKVSQCHRYPPSLPSDDEHGSQPWTYETDWCGEWEGNKDIETRDLSLMKIEELNLSIRALNALCPGHPDLWDNIDTVAKLVNCTCAELLRRRRLGRASLRDIINALAVHGLKLK